MIIAGTLNLTLIRGCTFEPIVMNLLDTAGPTRTVTDATTRFNNNVISSATAVFTSADIGAFVSIPGVPALTIITTIIDTTHVALSQNAFATGSGLTLVITQVNYVDATGWTVAAEVRATPGGSVLINLSPSFTNASNGEITIPGINDETTATYVAATNSWDLIVEDLSDNMQKIFAGSFIIQNKITQS